MLKLASVFNVCCFLCPSHIERYISNGLSIKYLAKMVIKSSNLRQNDYLLNSVFGDF